MIPDTLRSQLRETAERTYDDVKAELDAGTDEWTLTQQKQQAIHELTTDSEFISLGSGAGRAAVTHPELDPFAVKIALYTPREKYGFPVEGIAQNQREAWTWDNLPEPLENRFTPVERILEDGRLLVMPVVTTDHDEIPYDAAMEFVKTTKTELQLHDWAAIELDVNTVGKRNGELEIFDYGLPVEPRESLVEKNDGQLDDYRL